MRLFWLEMSAKGMAITSNSLARLTNHLTPDLRGIEIKRLKEGGGNISRLVATHMNTQAEAGIIEELGLLGERLEISITAATEGLVLEV